MNFRTTFYIILHGMSMGVLIWEDKKDIKTLIFWRVLVRNDSFIIGRHGLRHWHFGDFFSFLIWKAPIEDMT